ncbi:MAG: 5-amino-6-(D-ribitylamino)uracil--L-tyrosine 4-hydroxyphenyl transferase CofH [Actinomycetota bacterium]|jgi:7,8-didemethyl-8-hydroxy-5-deazariboflavin synthase CofH subunit/7,8-didemethyl-8-hydroxy-5-deazariboflavin synthase CofG subunit
MATIPAARDLGVLSLDALMVEAAAVRDAAFGRRITWSPRITIALTQACRRPGDDAFLDPEQVLAIAWGGAEAGCHEAVFTADSHPELRHPEAADWLARRGYDSTIDYLVAACQLVLDETGLLPRTDVGVVTADERRALRAVAPAQGLVLRGLGGDLTGQFRSIETAGALRIPFSVGLPVGAGESRDDRVETLRRLAELHQDHGHLQEVVVLPPSSAVEQREWRETVALARLILPETVSLQAGSEAALDAGIDDWGGLEPAEVETVRRITEGRGFALIPRLGLRAAYARAAEEWIDPALHFAVLDRSDADGLARDDPGAVLPHRFATRANPGSGAEVTPIGPRSTAWYSGGDGEPPALLPARAEATGAVREVLDGLALGQTAGEEELLTLLAARGPEVAAVCEAADGLRRAAVGDVVTFVRNRNINYTNVCTYRCRFCGFSKGPLSLNLRGKPYLLTLEEVVERVVDAARRGATEVCLQGGIHPDFDGEYYLHLVQAVKAAAPAMHVHGFTALEVFEGARRLTEPLESYLRRLHAAGLGSLPGTAAEILDDEIRAAICPDKITTDEWLEVHRTAHRVGLRSNITIMFGTIERPRHWVRHLLRTRALQAETGGFTEFVPLPFVHMAAPIYLERRARRGPTFREALLLHAVGRIAYHGLVDNIQGSWVKLGLAGMAQVLQAGVNDLGGTLMGENISRAAGARHGQELTEDEFRTLVAPLGRPLEQRTTLYGRV